MEMEDQRKAAAKSHKNNEGADAIPMMQMKVMDTTTKRIKKGAT